MNVYLNPDTPAEARAVAVRRARRETRERLARFRALWNEPGIVAQIEGD